MSTLNQVRILIVISNNHWWSRTHIYFWFFFGEICKTNFYTAIEQIEDLETLIYNCSSKSIEVPQEIRDFMESELVKRAIGDNERLQYYLKQIEEFSKDWELYEKSDDTTIYFKPSDNEDGSLTFGGESIIKSHMTNPWAVLFEHDLLHQWVPTVKRVDLVKEQCLLKKLIHLKIDLYTPFSDRDLMCEGTGVLLEDEKAACFIMRSEPSDSFFGKSIDPDCEGRVRMNMKHGFMHMQYIDEHTCKFRIIMNVDMKISLTQGWVGKMIMNKVIKVWIYTIAKKSEDFKGSEFAKRLIRNPLYRLLTKRLNISFPEKDQILNTCTK